MSDTRQGPDWWMANDGKWYPGSSATTAASSPPLPPPPAAAMGSSSNDGLPHYRPGVIQNDGSLPPIGGSSPGTSTVLIIAVGMAVVAGLVAIVASGMADGFYDEYLSARVGTRAGRRAFRGYEQSLLVAGIAWGIALSGLVTFFFLLASWSFSTYRVVERIPAPNRKWSKWWALGSWFVPVMGIVLPVVVLSEANQVLMAARQGSPERWRQQRLSRPLIGYGAATMGAVLLALSGVWVTTWESDAAGWLGAVAIIATIGALVSLLVFVDRTEATVRALRSASRATARPPV
jgi:hypothetical protein